MPLDYEQLVNRRFVRNARSRSPSVTRRDDYRRRMSLIEDDLVDNVHKAFAGAHEVEHRSRAADLGWGTETAATLPRSTSASHADRKYDVYGMRTWSYPIWKYLNTNYYTHYSSYTPPLMTSDPNRTYSGVAPLAGEHSYQFSAGLGGGGPYVAGTGMPYRRYHSRRSDTPWYRDYSSVGLRHFGSYRPRYAAHSARPVWASYY